MVRRKRKDSLLGIGVAGVTSITTIGLLPNPTGSSAVTTMKEKSTQGISNVGKTLPTHGKLIGTRMVLKATRKLKKKLKGGNLL